MKKRAVMLIHGFTENCEISFSQFLMSVKFKKYDIIQYNISGHDPNSDEEFDYKLELERVNAFVSDLTSKYEEVNLIGFSLGGALAGYIASKHPINRLVLIAPAYKYFNNVEVSKNFVTAAKEIIKNKSIKEGIESFIEHKNSTENTVYVDIQKMDKSIFPSVLNFVKIIDEIRDTMDIITCPTLIIHGELDELIPVASSLYALEKVTSEEKLLVVVPNSFHRVLKDKNCKDYHLMIERFIQKGSIKWTIKSAKNKIFNS